MNATGLLGAHWIREKETVKAAIGDGRDGELYFTDTRAWMRYAVDNGLYPEPPMPSPTTTDSASDGEDEDATGSSGSASASSGGAQGPSKRRRAAESESAKVELPSHWDIKEFQSHMRNKVR